MTKGQLIEKLGDLEWEEFEVKAAKSEVPKSSWETVSAFANTNGGWLVFGVGQVGKGFEIQGVDNAEKIEQDFLSTMNSKRFNKGLGIKSHLYAGTKPQYDVAIDSVMVTVHYQSQKSVDTINDTLNRTINLKEQPVSEIMEFFSVYNISISKKEALVLQKLDRDNTITRSQLSDNLGIAQSTVSIYLKALVDKKVIVRTGSKKAGKWEFLMPIAELNNESDNK